MKKFKTIIDLDNAIEKVIKKTVQAYYTDWKNHDRPKYMKLKGSTDPREQLIILVARKCGTYLYSYNDLIDKNYNFPLECLDYYFNYERHNTDFYIIDLNRKSLEKLTDKKFLEVYNRCKFIKNQEEKAA